MDIMPDEPVYPYEHAHKCGIDLRTWMATQMLAAFITGKGYDGMRCEREAVQTADRLIAELNKPKP